MVLQLVDEASEGEMSYGSPVQGTSEFAEGLFSSSGLEVVTVRETGGTSATAERVKESGITAVEASTGGEESSAAKGRVDGGDGDGDGEGSDDDVELGDGWEEEEKLEDLPVEGLPLVHGKRMKFEKSLYGVEPFGWGLSPLFHPKPRRFYRALYFASYKDSFLKQGVRQTRLKPEIAKKLREMPYMTMPCKYDDMFWPVFRVTFDILDGYEVWLARRRGAYF